MKRILPFLCLLLAACASGKKEEEAPLAPADANAFEQGTRALDQERYAEAARIFDQLLVAKPATEVDLITTFNSGAAYEGLGNCHKAADRYREVVRSSAGKFQRVESQALYRLSLMYECLGQDPKAITALLDARKRGKELAPSVLQAEIPARLAAAYGRIGNRAKAMEYFAQANQGLKNILASGPGGHRQINQFAQTVYLMGQLNPGQRRADGDGIAFLQGLSMQQPYLLQAVESGHSVYARKAAEDLDMAYDNIWKYKYNDPEKQRQFYTRGLQAAAELKRIRLPEKSDALLDQVFEKVESTERRLQTEIAKAPDLNRLTPESEKREGLKREGRLVDPNSLKPKPRKKKKP